MKAEQELKQEIINTMVNAKMWMRKPTTAKGIFLIKVPQGTEGEKVMIEINPVNDQGIPIKRRGLFLSDVNQLREFSKVFSSEKAVKAVKAVQEINKEINMGNLRENPVKL